MKEEFGKGRQMQSLIYRNAMRVIKQQWLVTIFCLFVFNAPLVQADDQAAIEALIQASKARAAIVKKVKDAVVHIRVERLVQGQGNSNNSFDFFNEELERLFPGRRFPQQNPRFRQEGLGSGAILDKRGYVITNHHVVGDADKIIVRLSDGTEVEGKLIGTDRPSDIAVIKIESENLKVIPIGNSDDIDVGESVIAIGNPFGLSQTVTFGIISAKGRSGVGITEYENFIQTDAAINPGNSGGPLINLKGEIIGVNTAIYTRSGSYNGIGFTVPINMAQSIMNDLIETGTVSRGYLGVGIQDVDSALAKRFGLKENRGVMITSVLNDYPADAAGIEVGDVVIGLDGKPIQNMNEFRNKIALARSNTTVELELIRKGKVQKIKVTLAERPQDPTNNPRKPEVETFMGMSVEDVTVKTQEDLGYEMESGVVITEVEPDSPAEEAGLQPGVLITEVDRTVIKNKDDFKEAMQQADEEEGVLLLIQNQQGSRYIIVTESK